MADHSELAAEIPMVEKMSTAERLKHAKKRRTYQLKKFAQYEKQLDKENAKRKKAGGNAGKKAKRKKGGRVLFVNNIVLLEAAARNDIDEVRSLLIQGVSPDVTNEDGLTALHQCCIDDCEDMTKLLVEFGANVNARDSELWTPLHAAATCGHVHLCKYLIDKGAELLAVNADGNMPYDICEDEVTLDYIESEMAKRGITQELIDETRLSVEIQMLEDLRHIANRNADLEFEDRSGATPIHIAAANGYIQVAEFLLDHHVNVDVRDNDDWQPIHAAACWGHPAILEMLVANGADLEAKTKNGETPFDICEDPELKQRIIELRDEIETSKARRMTELVRRKSSNPRSASVRRSSMREKSLLSWKEAKEEAQMMREASAGITSDEERENEQNGYHNGNHNFEDKENIPTSNIDDISVTVPMAVDTMKRRDRDIIAERESEPAQAHTASSGTRHNNDRKMAETKQSHHEPQTQQPMAAPSHQTTNSLGHSPVENDIPYIDSRRGSQGVVPSGTLADLKKQRSQQLQNSLRYRDTALLESDMAPYKDKDNDMQENKGNNVTRNGHGLGNDRPNAYVPRGDQQLHRFSAIHSSEIIGGDDSKQRCCVVM